MLVRSNSFCGLYVARGGLESEPWTPVVELKMWRVRPLDGRTGTKPTPEAATVGARRV